MRLTLKAIQQGRAPKAFERFKGRKVLIWSAQWLAWWRPESAGYTSAINDAGIYDFDDAYKRTLHCGPEKRIEYITIKEPRS
jgi:hypothetical protein